jgi:Mg-chelatase subunit ChlD
MAANDPRHALALLASVLVGATLAVGLASCERSEPKIQTDDWQAITDQQWPPDTGEDIELATHPQRTNIAVVLDMSGSMSGQDCAGDYASKAEAARAALATWVDSLPRDANLGLIVFDDHGIRTLVPLGTDNRERFLSAADDVRPGGSTPLQSAMTRAQTLLTERGRYQLGYGRYQLVTITDGEHSGGENPLPVVEGILSNPANPIEIHTIGFCIDDSALRQPGLVAYRSANDPDELARGLSSVLAESTSFEPPETFDE